MNFITPLKRLKVDTGKDAEYMSGLPCTVIIHKAEEDGREEKKAYLIENKDWTNYSALVGEFVFAPAERIEEPARKVGRLIDLEDFKESTGYQLSHMGSPDGKSYYSIYATEFKSKPKEIQN